MLLDDAERSPESDSASFQQFSALATNFAYAWREVWSEHGMKPSGWPLYHYLVAQMDKALATVSPDLILASNEVEFSPAFRGLVLYSAINEEFAPQYLGSDELPEKLEQAIRSFSPKQETSDDTPMATQSMRRNDPCHCGSGMRYKHCHGRRQ